MNENADWHMRVDRFFHFFFLGGGARIDADSVHLSNKMMKASSFGTTIRKRQSRWRCSDRLHAGFIKVQLTELAKNHFKLEYVWISKRQIHLAYWSVWIFSRLQIWKEWETTWRKLSKPISSEPGGDFSI